MPSKFQFESPSDALQAVASRLLSVVRSESVATSVGRVLAADASADRDSPAADVSAMDGYAMRMNSLQKAGDLLVKGECVPGSPPPPMPDIGVLRIFTGAVVPAGCDAVVKREDCLESADTIRWKPEALDVQAGDHIRRQGENTRRGEMIIGAGEILDAPQLAALCNFGIDSPDVLRKIRVALLTTGDELVASSGGTPEAAPLAAAPISPWQIRNSNRVAIESMLSRNAWIEPVTALHASDKLVALTNTLADAVAKHDAVILTGGVSMGDYDFVPQAAANLGAETVFHKLPVRPGKPIFAATLDGKLILGLPGNPVSATIGCRRFAVPLLAKIAGIRLWNAHTPVVELTSPGTKTLPLHWMRLVRLIGGGAAEIVPGKGSGDLVAMGKSDGFIEMPPGENSAGPWPYYSW